jgi:hypothetical protein
LASHTARLHAVGDDGPAFLGQIEVDDQRNELSAMRHGVGKFFQRLFEKKRRG